MSGVESRLARRVDGEMAAVLGREFTGSGRVAAAVGGRYSGWASVVSGSEVRLSSFMAAWVPFQDLARRFVARVRGRLDSWPDAMPAVEVEGDELVFRLVRPVSAERGRRYEVTGATRRF